MVTLSVIEFVWLLLLLLSCQQSLEQRVARWEDFRSELMRSAEAELGRDPFQVGKGDHELSTAV